MKIKTGILIIFISSLISVTACAQQKGPIVRIAKLQIDPAQLETYKSILKEEIETSIRLEPGVITLYAVSDKKNPANVTIFETYASVEAYESHLKSSQFIKYKTSTDKMVRSLELVPCDPIALGKQ